ncbi:IS66 family insertion sequence element accessory protein TnpB [Sulfobacillus thermosulfidooxidans]|uniref:IS66 family insertion sequence element accessory protein TnpB n=1 Tax=Sulfobacillus thermosulfidooxidans TaxID=28034 RepID=UPI0014943DB3|nr:IS66 family insertion sequence element accessory protein TnpB [Sulfobacillus thermosulfidooxidans]
MGPRICANPSRPWRHWDQLTFQLDPCSSALFVFCHRDRTQLKILEWDEAGFWLHDRRLEYGHIQWPTRGDTATQSITLRPWQWLLDGLALDQPEAHRPLRGRRIV